MCWGLFMKHMKKGLRIFLILFAIICLIAACFLTVKYFLQDKQTEDELDKYRSEAQEAPSLQPTAEPIPEETFVVPSEETAVPDTSPEATPLPTNTPAPTPAPVSNPYAEAYLANSDTAGWLVIPGTNIDYPVMWTPEDENYYLYRDFDGSENANGCLILDTDSSPDPVTTNLIIHGHNMKSGAMFGNLTDYEDEEYFRAHQQIILHTKTCQRNYEVIAVFRSQVYKKTDNVFKFYKFFQANTQEEFDDFYNNIKALSLYDTGVSAKFGDRFITLSTCAYHVENGRFVVVAKETEPGNTYLPIEN